ncbi:hypothetical protein RKE30_21505 [Streptomyces sp. Li-HN-5-11]|uniref:hypothetical protein n=1 Tax=Streptomyces sp. Li-HN-5-11 TaxID=3075432 RepID=UPI0028B023C6|nr:hypothetical protein [Streptomyces sp. Li-HN-5-11]WNM32791.1 hypothetical protein RKE30_21505 [Streptomyces sp. Li-HN-5-11]
MRRPGDHGTIPVRGIRDTYTEAHTVLDEPAGVGVDYADVVQVLEDEGVTKFDESREELAGKLTAALNGPASGRTER